jgi:hypothetical protein
MVKGLHAEHTSRGETGVDHWPNDSYRLAAEPHDLIEDLSHLSLSIKAQDNIAASTRAHARRSDPATSHQGAIDVTPRLGGQRKLLFEAYEASPTPMTSWEAGQATGLAAKPGCCYWHRVGDLVELGLLEPTGVERMMPTGSLQAEYRVMRHD